MPVHVVFRAVRGVYSLRSQRSFNVLKRVFARAANRFRTRILHFSVLGNHIHLIVESEDQKTLACAMKGLGVRIAKGMNGLMDRRGQVIEDRHFTRVVDSPRGAANVIRYVRENHRKHFGKPGEWKTGVSTDAFSSWSHVLLLPKPKTWIMCEAGFG